MKMPTIFAQAALFYWALLLLTPELSSAASTGPVEKPRTRIESDQLRMEGSPNQNLFIFEGNVSVTGRDLNMSCERMEVTASRSGEPEATVGAFGAVERILATGRVVINQAERTAYAERAEVDPSVGLVILSGSPRIVDPHAEITGWKIILDRASKSAKVLPSPDAPPLSSTDPNTPRQRSTVILGGQAIPEFNFDNRPVPAPSKAPQASPEFGDNPIQPIQASAQEEFPPNSNIPETQRTQNPQEPFSENE